ncbi:chorismate mutase [Aerococcaceae bacterium DSM 111022]|nr:chorismate mutase [Aerococcaceae bacterium DSM 111022]
MSKHIDELRQEINQIDEQLVALIEARMEVAQDIAAYKQANDLPVFDEVREQEVIEKNVALLKNQTLYGSGYREIIQKIMDASKDIQREYLSK